MKIALVLLLGLGLVLALAWLRGSSLPREHSLTLTTRIVAPLAQVAARIADLPAHIRWRRGIKSIEILSEGADGTRYLEDGPNGSIKFHFARAGQAEFQSRIDDPTLPFGGQWTFTLRDQGESTELSIREDGSVSSPLFRFVAHDLFGYDRSIRHYLEDLQRSFEVPDSRQRLRPEP